MWVLRAPGLENSLSQKWQRCVDDELDCIFDDVKDDELMERPGRIPSRLPTVDVEDDLECNIAGAEA